MMKDETLQEIHGELTKAESALRDLARRVKQDSKAGVNVCRNFTDWAATPPDNRLDRAKRRLEQEFYRVGIAGIFSSGKSTIINALLREPDLLPTASHVCTLTRTIMRAPEEGSGERVEVHYWSQDEAIRKVVRNSKFNDAFDADDRTRAESGSVNVDDIHTAIRRCQEGDREQQALAQELREFVDALDIHASRLGRVHTVPLSEKDQFLRTTAVEENGVTRLVGIGHIRCIAHAILYVNNPLFTEEHIELMDLPGTDDPDPTQKQITYDALKTIDVLISAVYGSKGLNEEDLAIIDEMVAHHHAVTEKTFFTGNRMDDIQVGDVTNASLEGLLSDGLIKHLTKRGFDATRVYFVSALYSELLCMEQRRLPMNEEQRTTLDSLRQKCDDLGNKLSADIRPDLKDLLTETYKDGGIAKLREDLISYLKHDIKTTHFKEVQTDLGDVLTNLDGLLEPERADAWDLDSDESALDTFIEDATNQFENIVYTFEENLEKAFPKVVVQLDDMVKSKVENLLARDNKAINFRKIRSELPSPGAFQVKTAVITKARDAIGKEVINLIAGQLAKKMSSAVVTKLGELAPRDAFEKLDEQLESNLADRYANAVEAFEKGLHRACELRVNEEIHNLRGDIPEPNPGGGDWSQELEESFRGELTKLFTDKLSARIGRFDKVLPVHFKFVSHELVDTLKSLLSDLARLGRKRDDLEMPVFAGVDLDPEELRRRSLKGYLHSYEIAAEALKSAGVELKSIAS